MAVKRTQCLVRRLRKDPAMSITLQNQISQMLEDGYIRKMSLEEENNESERTWYLPIFPVTNPSKPNKVRLVWDAAAVYQNVSLNKMLLTGPDTLPPLIQPLNRFRERKVAINGDIRQMFHQIIVRKQDQDSQRFLWPSQDGTIVTFVMQAMTFGAACSPSAAQHVKNMNAREFENKYPRAVKSIVENHYVDDMMDSCDNETEAIQLAQQVKEIHAKGGFHIRGWKSNSRQVTKMLDGADTATNLDLEAENEKVLGIWWSPIRDTLTYSLKYTKVDANLLNLSRKPTKREVLSLVMSIFDPNGHLAHFVLQLRILLQESWREGHHWDEEVNDEQFTMWSYWVRQLPKIESLEIPRCYLTSIDNYERAEVQLHMFVDAGKEAYAAVAYLRVKKNRMVNVAQIGAKVKVAPLEPVSVPRLELQAALIGSRYAQTIRQTLSIKIDKTHFWSDSTTVLGWLHSRRKYKPFVAYRVAEIRETTDLRDWHYIPTQQNVADDATKSRKKIDLDPEGRWFTGPQFLHQDETFWPTVEMKLIAPEEDAIHIGDAFAHEIQLLKDGIELDKTSSVYDLAPYLDEEGLIRLESRLENATVPFDMRRPIPLPSNHHITRLIIQNYHEKCLHQNHSTVLNNLR